MNVEELVAVYVNIRDQKKTIQEEADAKIDALDRDMKVIAEHLLELCKELGADNIRTGHGTVIRTIKTKYWTSDWASMYDFVREHNAFDLLEKRIHQTNMKNFLEENPEECPVGVNVEKEYAITVRRK
jgi:sugar phosphate isomerase/epimerase